MFVICIVHVIVIMSIFYTESVFSNNLTQSLIDSYVFSFAHAYLNEFTIVQLSGN